MRKKILIGVAVLFLVLIAVVAAVILNLDRLVKTGVETGGTTYLQVPTTLDSASVSLLGGKAGLNQLVIGSPTGFTADHMMSLHHASLTMDVWSIRSDTVVIHEVVVDGAEITFEVAGGKSNWRALLKNLEGEPSPPAPPPSKTAQPAAPGQRYAIDRIVFKNGTIRISGIPLAKQATVPLPPLIIEDLKTDEGGGLSGLEVTRKVVRALAVSVVTAVKQVVSVEELEKVLGKGQDVLGNIGSGTVDVLKGAGEKTRGTIDEIFKKKK